MDNQDKIILEGIILYGYHGRNQPEKEIGQTFVIDIEVERDLRMAGTSDQIEGTVSYTDIYRVVKEIIEGPSLNLLESVAHNIAHKIIDKYSVDAVRVKVKKPSPPIKDAILSGAAIEIYRRKNG
jgi:dihydroneopterin aldolase